MDFVSAAIPGQAEWFTAVIEGVVKSRKSAGVIAFAALFWSALRFFQALVHGVNKAWGTKEYSWWRMPIQNLFMVGHRGERVLSRGLHAAGHRLDRVLLLAQCVEGSTSISSS